MRSQAPRGLQDEFDGEPLPHWTRWLAGTGRLEKGESSVRLLTRDAQAERYSDAQLDDYHGREPGGDRGRKEWLWRPPLRLEVRARASAPALAGTAGFGFWNEPFTPGSINLLNLLPESIWFFYASPPSDMALVPGVAGHGWKAAVVHAARPGALAVGAPTGAAVLWARLTGRTGTAGKWVQRVSGAQEALLQADWTDWHTYEIEWRPGQATFRVDGAEVLAAPHPPRGPLGFVAWLDNQFAIVTPQARFGWGLLEAPGDQWLELDYVRIHPVK